ncbi:MAG: hypothetical protein FD123_3433 [Bacteroidetes bacterium]|nr:MAG: hypothetical protein FD123_3433 [Bacteroidota bacterium]
MDGNELPECFAEQKIIRLSFENRQTMNNYLLALGWWNFAGSLMMIGFFHPPFGKKMLNDWTKIFSTEFSLDYWGKFWLAWAIGLNIFFGLVNILSVSWGYAEVQKFLVWADLSAYSLFVVLAFWGIRAGRCGSGIYSALLIFAGWIGWGIYTLITGSV